MSDPSPPFEVVPFTDLAFFNALATQFFSPEQASKKSHSVYLAGYLRELGAQTIVTEHGYVDGDYLDDFAAYYVKCFTLYERRCKRLHFFSTQISSEELTKALTEQDLELRAKLESSYLGFIVVRPLPNAVIGKTVLSTYAPDSGRRHYTATTPYDANLFGLGLKIQSLAFQEQDSVLAACATVALWCCFQKTSQLFHSPRPSPVTITRAATQFVHESRPIPSHALNVHQMCNAIKSQGLEPEVFAVSPGLPLVSLMHGYLQMGLPVVLGVNIDGIGLHAITICGYSLRKERVLKSEIGSSGFTGVPMVGLRIDEFYAHDDQFGPFCRVKVIEPSPNPKSPIALHGAWKDAAGAHRFMYPIVAIVPIYNKIRLTFADVHEWLLSLSRVIETVADLKSCEWDLHLVTTNEYKRLLQDSAHYTEVQLRQSLLMQHPRFIWRAVLRHEDQLLLEFLADATDMAGAIPIYQFYWLNIELRDAVAAVISSLDPSFLRQIVPDRLLLALNRSILPS